MTVLTVFTTYSEYEIDVVGKRARKVTGEMVNTHNVPNGGQWRTYEEVGYLLDGLFFIWGMEGMILRRTLTSRVIYIEASRTSR